jgi:hypothetical protein
LIASERSETGLLCCAYLSRISEVVRQIQEASVTSNENEPSVALLPAAIAAVLALIGVVGMIVVFVSAGQVPDGDVGMRSVDAAYRAGATITPTVPTPGSAPSRSIKVADEARQDL